MYYLFQGHSFSCSRKLTPKKCSMAKVNLNKTEKTKYRSMKAYNLVETLSTKIEILPLLSDQNFLGKSLTKRECREARYTYFIGNSFSNFMKCSSKVGSFVHNDPQCFKLATVVVLILGFSAFDHAVKRFL